MSRARIMVVEDDPAIAEIVAYNLRQQDYDVDVCHDGAEALRKARADVPDLIVLDLMLPSLDGIEICRQLRANSSTDQILVLMLTAKSEETDQVIGFAVNADDYVTKPFSVKVLLERIRILLRRRDAGAVERDVISKHGIVIDQVRHTARIHDRLLDLTPTEFSILAALVAQPGRAFRRIDLIDAAMRDEAIVLERTIDVHIRSLRKKLGADAHVIETVRGVGYRLKD